MQKFQLIRQQSHMTHSLAWIPLCCLNINHCMFTGLAIMWLCDYDTFQEESITLRHESVRKNVDQHIYYQEMFIVKIKSKEVYFPFYTIQNTFINNK